MQDDWKLGAGITVNAGLRYDVFGNFTERDGRIGNYYLPDVAAKLGVQPGFQVPGNAPFFASNFTPLSIGLSVDPGTPIDLSQIHVAKNESTIKPDLQQRRAAHRLRLAAVVRAEGRRAWRLGPLLRAHRRQLQARPAAVGAVLLLPERAGAARTWPTRIRG